MRAVVIWLSMLMLISWYGNAQNLVEAEYFFDSDPGIGNGTSLAITSAESIDNTYTIPTSSLTTGFHFLVIRYKDNNGIWSHAERKSLYIAGENEEIPVLSDLDAYEYFFNADPGVGNGTVVSIGAVNSLDDLYNIPFEGLEPGFNNFGIRFRNSNGIWSKAEFKSFYIQSASEAIPETSNIIAYEYFFGTDPGQGQATKVDLTQSSDSVDQTVMIPLPENLESGFFTLGIRFQNEDGIWSTAEAKSFYKADLSEQVTLSDIVAAEYFFNDDPGFGQGTSISVSQGSIVEENLVIPTTGLAEGENTLNIRVKNQDGVWSFYEQRVFNICQEIPSVALSETGLVEFCTDTQIDLAVSITGVQTGETITWYKDDGLITNAQAESYTITDFGTYYAVVEGEAGCTATTDSLEVAPLNFGALSLSPETTEPLCFGSTNEVSIIYEGNLENLDFTWLKDGVEIDHTGDSLIVENAGTYQVTTVVDGCEFSSDPIEIIIGEDFTLDIGGDFATCTSSADFTLAASPASGEWTGFVENASGLFSPSSLGSGSYDVTYTYTDNAGCSESQSITITISDQIEVLIDALPPIAYLDSLPLSAAPQNGEWSGEDITAEGYFTPQRAGQYTLSYSFDPDGCGGTDEVTFEVEKADQVIIFNPLEVKTFGDEPFALEANAESELEVVFSSSDENVATVSGNTVTIVGGGSSVITASQVGNDNYNEAPNVSQELVVERAEQEISIEQVEDKFITSDDFEIIASTTSGLELSYQILSGPATIAGNLVSLTGETGTIEVEVSQEGNEDYNRSSATTSITVLPDPCIDFAVNASVTDEISCQGANDGAIFLSVENGTSPFTYYLNGNELDGSFAENLSAGQYEISVLDANDCNAETSIVLDEPQALQIAEEITDNTSIYGDGVISLTVTGGTGNYSYEWDNGESTQQIDGLLMGSYTVTVTDGNGCSLTETYEVGGVTGNNDELESDVIIYPNPSNHDVQVIHSEEIESLTLYDVYGRVLFESQPNTNEATVDISKLSTGSYFMRLNKGKMHRIIKQ